MAVGAGRGRLVFRVFVTVLGQVNPNAMNGVPLERSTMAKFSGLLRTEFLVRRARPHNSVQLELVQVTAGGTVAKDGANLDQYESFSLLSMALNRNHWAGAHIPSNIRGSELLNSSAALTACVPVWPV